MNGTLEFMNRLWKGFDALTAARKVAVVAAGMLTLFLLSLMVYMTNQINYRPLFSGLTDQDASTIIDRLKDLKISYKLSGSGNSILVPEEKISELRVELAASGIPRGGGAGFEIFDKKSFGATEFEQELNYRRALQGELSRTISGLDIVDDSRVHIALPKESVFLTEKKSPSASVTVRLKPGRKLSDAQVDGIVHLVANSVEGMLPENVMIVDNTGNILSRYTNDTGPGKAVSSQMDYQAKLETDLSNRIQTMLERVLGQGKSVVRVSAEIDFSLMEKTEEIFDPDSQVIRSVQRQSEKNPSPAAPGGTPEGGMSGEGRERSDETINYEINKVLSKTVLPTGDIKRLSIAVAVDGIYEKDQSGKEIFQQRPKKELDSLEDLVRKSAGIVAGRGDQIVMTCMPFRKEMTSDGPETTSFWGNLLSTLLPLLKYVMIMALFFFAFIFVVRPIVRSLVERTEPRPAGEVGELVSGGTVPRIAAGPSLLAGPSGGEVMDIDLARQLAGENPKKFAELLRNWLR